MTVRYDIVGLVLLAIAGLWLLHRRERRSIKLQRGAFFDDCLDLFSDAHLAQDDVDYPVLQGRYGDHRVRLEPVVDHVVIRKLPSLWLLVTVFGELPIKGTVDFLVRPQNTEFYSPSAGLPESLPIPPGWPQHAHLRTDMSGRSAPVELLTPHMVIFDDPRTKELAVTPRGVRIVYQVGQAERAYYLVLRQARFSELRVDRELARRLLDRAIAVYNSIDSLQ